MRGDSETGLPSGFIPRIEFRQRQLEFLADLNPPEWVMVGIDDADRWLNSGETALRFAKSKVITTTTILDRKLEPYHLDREVRLVRAFRPAAHIPFDIPVYEDDSENRILSGIRDQVDHSVRFVQMLADPRVRVLPLVKGATQEQIEYCLSLYRAQGIRELAYYVAQYFGNGRGSYRSELIRDVSTIAQSSEVDYLLVVGLGAESIIRQLPPNARAFASMRWRTECSLGEVSVEESARRFGAYSNSIGSAKRHRVIPLDSFGESP